MFEQQRWQVLLQTITLLSRFETQMDSKQDFHYFKQTIWVLMMCVGACLAAHVTVTWHVMQFCDMSRLSRDSDVRSAGHQSMGANWRKPTVKICRHRGGIMQFCDMSRLSRDSDVRGSPLSRSVRHRDGILLEILSSAYCFCGPHHHLILS